MKTYSTYFRIIPTNHIIIEAFVNSVKGFFIIDTGATHSCIDLKKIKKFKLDYTISHEKMSSATHQIDQTFNSKNNILKISDLKKNNFEIILFDLSHANKLFNEEGIDEVDGIIGGDILKEFNAKINYKEKIVCLEF